MKIDTTSKAAGSNLVSGAASAQRRPADTAAQGGSGEQVHLSPLSAQLQSIESAMADTPVVDSARVAEIRQAISEGRFKVNAEAVADHLVQTARELIHARTS